MNTCPNCGKIAGLHSSILQGCMCQYSMQEPVAYIHRNEYDEYRLEPHDNFDIKSIPFNIDVPLFKSPQRTWVDLTDEEIDNINYTSAHMLAREVLAKFKDKNT